MKTFSSIYRPEENIFSGLNRCAIRYLYEFGMWIPVNYEVLEIDNNLSHTTELVYGTYKDKDFVMSIIVDRGEMLTGKIWSAAKGPQEFGPVLLHEYVMLDGTTVREYDQLTVNDAAFKYLVDSKDNIVCQWEEQEIKYFLDNMY